VYLLDHRLVSARRQRSRMKATTDKAYLSVVSRRRGGFEDKDFLSDFKLEAEEKSEVKSKKAPTNRKRAKQKWSWLNSKPRVSEISDVFTRGQTVYFRTCNLPRRSLFSSCLKIWTNFVALFYSAGLLSFVSAILLHLGLELNQRLWLVQVQARQRRWL